VREIKRIVEQFNTLKNKHQFAIATIIDIEGSSYRRIGTKMLIADNGNWWGGISGGCLEGDVLKKALNSINTGVPRVVSYDTRDEDPHEIGIGLGCNGLIKIFINPRNVYSTIELLTKSLTTREDSHYLVSISNVNPKILPGDIFSIDTIEKSYAKQFNSSIFDLKSERSPQIIEIENSTYFLQFHRPLIHVVIFGSNYDALITARLASEVGYNTTLIAPKRHINNPSFKVADRILPFEQGVSNIDKETAIVLMNHDLEKDQKSLQAYLGSSAFYIGLLGPKTRGEKLTKNVTKEEKRNIYFPAGLDTGATSPEEIALSILAEIKAVYSKRNGSHLKNRQHPIYEN